MSRKWKLIIAVIAGVVVLSLVGGSIALADNSQQSNSSNPYLAAVATKLGVDEATLTSAVKEAQKEIATTAINNALDNAVTKGIITTDEETALKTWLAQEPVNGDKAAMKTWWDQRPNLANPKVYNGMIWKRAVTRMYGWCTGNLGINNTDFINKVATLLNKPAADVQSAFQSAATDMKSAALQKSLDNAVKNGKITQDEANQIQSWWNSRPAAVDKLAPGPGGFGMRGTMKRMMGRFFGRDNTQTTTAKPATN